MIGRAPRPPAPERPRLFVAVELPEDWLRALERLMQTMEYALRGDPRVAASRVRWVRMEDIHLTLKFIGEVPAERLPAIEAALMGAVTSPPRFGLRLGRPGTFDPRSPRVVWAGVEGATQALSDLAAQVDEALAGAGIPREKRPFEPHLTLARLPDELRQKVRQDIVGVTTAIEVPHVPPFNVERVSLMQSHLSIAGARYERLAAYPTSV